MASQEYLAYLENKRQKILERGFDVPDEELNTNLFPFQRFILHKALKAGKYAVFADCGTGKSLMQLEWSRQVAKRENKPVIILAPLAVVGQTIQEGQKFSIAVTEYEDEATPITEGIYITNYENLPHINASQFCGIVLDESSILKNFDGETKKALIDTFANTPYKLACTATPSPNDVMELCNHAEFLNVMGRNEMLAMYFVHDGGETTKWRLKGHCRQLFWDFVSEWSIMLCKPSDIGFDDTGYDLPQLNIIDETIITPKGDNGLLFNDASVNATDFNQELRNTINERMERVAQIVNGSPDSFIIWVKQDAEEDMVKKLIPEAVGVRGSEPPKVKRDKLLGFANGQFRVLVTKLKIAQFGMNFQNCHNQIFASLDFSFEGTYQGMRRSWRFGQTHEVNIYLICTDTMSNVKATIEKKQCEFSQMQKAMTKATNKNLQRKTRTMAQREYKQVTLPNFI